MKKKIIAYITLFFILIMGINTKAKSSNPFCPYILASINEYIIANNALSQLSQIDTKKDNIVLYTDAIGFAQALQSRLGNLLITINNYMQRRYNLTQNISYKTITLNSIKTMTTCNVNYTYILALLAAKTKITRKDIQEKKEITSPSFLKKLKKQHVQFKLFVKMSVCNSALLFSIVKIGDAAADSIKAHNIYSAGEDYVFGYIYVLLNTISKSDYTIEQKRFALRVLYDFINQNCNDLRSIITSASNTDKKIASHIYDTILVDKEFCE